MHYQKRNMANGKLGSQLAATSTQSSGSGRVTRIQRLRVQLEQRKQREQFEALRQRAKDVQQQKFSNITSLDQYEKEYGLLSPELQQFFETPSQLREQQTQRIETNKGKVQERLSFTDQKLQDIEQKYRQDLQNANEIRDGERRSKRKDDLEDDYEKEREYWIGYKQGLNEGLGKLGSGKDLSYGDIENYADDLGYYRERREEAKNQNRKQKKEQQKKIDDLIEQGYKPQIIQESFKGTPQGTKLYFYNPSSNEFAKIDPIKLQTSDTKGLQKSSLGTAKVQQKIVLGGKKFTFNLNQQLYTDKSGKLSTTFGELGTTEQAVKFDLEKQTLAAQEKAIYARRKIISDQPRMDFVPITVPSESTGEKKEVVKFVTDLYKKIPEGKLYLNLGGAGFTPTASISPFKKNDKSIDLKELKQRGLEKIDTKISSTITDEIEREGIKAQLESKYQQEYQTRFEDKYFDDIVRGKITFEQASAEFEKSKDAKIVQKKYGEDVNVKRAELGFTKAGFKIAGLNLAKTGLTLTPTTTKGAVVEAALIYGGVKALKLIPPIVTYGATAGTGTYGVYKAVSPKSLPEERAGGVISAGLSAAIVSFKYLRTPTVKTEAINVLQKLSRLKKATKISPRLERKIVKDIYGKTTIIDKYKFSMSGEQVASGRRTIVTTKGRDLFGLKPIYQGVPYQDPSGYQTALKILQKRSGLSLAQAQSTLRYYQPRAFLSTTKGSTLLIYGDKYKVPNLRTAAIRTTKADVRVLNEALGIKTKGGTSIREFIGARGVQIGTKGDTTIYRSIIDVEKTFLTPKGYPYQKLTQAGKTTKQFEQISRVILKKRVDKDPLGFEFYDEGSLIKQTIPSGQFSTSRSDLIAFILKRKTPTISYDALDDLRSQGLKVTIKQQTSAPKQFFKSLDQYTGKDYKKLLKSLESIYGKPKPIKTPKLPKAVTGFSGGSASVQQQTSITGLRTVQLPPEQLSAARIKKITNIASRSSQESKVLQLQVAAIITGQRSGQRLRQAQRFDLSLRSAQAVAVKQEIRLRQATRQQQQTRQIQRPALQLPRLDIRFTPKPPTTTTTSTFRSPPTAQIRLPDIERLLEKRRGRKKEKGVDTYFLLPDFATRILGLSPEVVGSEKDALREINRIKTGLELRRGLIVR